jgi:hypothetical protein
MHDFPCISELETEIGIITTADKLAFCKYADGWGCLDIIISFGIGYSGDWYVSGIDVERIERGGKTVRRKLEGSLFQDCKRFLEQEEHDWLDEHVREYIGDLKPVWAA